MLLLTLVLVWIVSVVCVIDRGGRYVDLSLADGAMSVSWGSPWDDRRYWHDGRIAYQVLAMRSPGRTICIELPPPGAVLPQSARWTLQAAPVVAMRYPLSFDLRRLGVRCPSYDRFGYPVAAHNQIELPLLWLAIPLLIWLAIRIHQRNQARPGHCQNCRYNLSGNTTGVCPECGEKVTPSASRVGTQPA